MGMFDYSNLKSAGVAAKANTESGGFKPLEEGEWLSKFVKGERTMTQGRGGKPKRPMIVTEWKIGAKGNDRMHREILKVRFIMDIDFQADRFLTLMIEAGVDLSKVTADGDWDDVFDELEESRVQAKWKVYYNDDDKDEEGTVNQGAYPEYKLLEVPQGLTEDCEYMDSDHTPATPAEVAEATPAEPVKKKRKKKAEKVEPVAETPVAVEPTPAPAPTPAPEPIETVTEVVEEPEPEAEPADDGEVDPWD